MTPRNFQPKSNALDITKLNYDFATICRISNIPCKVQNSELEQICALYGCVIMTHMSKQSTALNTALLSAKKAAIFSFSRTGVS